MASTATLTRRTAEQRLLLHGVPWSTYETLLRCLEGRHLRLTYDRGDLGIMVVSSAHEWAKKMLARLVEALTASGFESISCKGIDMSDSGRARHSLGCRWQNWPASSGVAGSSAIRNW